VLDAAPNLPLFGGGTYPTYMKMIDLPPGSQSDAQLYPNARTWAAAEGYYGIGTISDAEVPFQANVSCTTPVMWQAPSFAQTTSGTTQNVWYFGPVDLANPVTPTSRVLPFDIHGAIFSGLNAQSTFQITTRYIIERLPSTSEPDLLVLTRPPSPFDPTALEIYSRTIAQLPSGCMVRENPLGEWFNDVLSTVAEWAPSVGAIFGPLGAAGGKALASGANAWLKERGASAVPSVMGQKPKKGKGPPRNNQQKSGKGQQGSALSRNQKRRLKEARRQAAIMGSAMKG